MRLIHSLCAVMLSLIAVHATPPLARAAESTTLPNVVYIMLDEWAYFELSCMGNKLLETPTIDRMAAEGLRLLSPGARPLLLPRLPDPLSVCGIRLPVLWCVPQANCR